MVNCKLLMKATVIHHSPFTIRKKVNTSELLHTIAKDRIAGLRTIDSYQLQPEIITVDKVALSLNLTNDMWILNTKALPEHLKQLEMISSDNVFVVTPAEYDLMDEYRYRVFSDYLDIKSETDNFQPFRLEFVKIIPHRN